MSIANSQTRRAEPRTEADLHKRGYKILSIGRQPNYGDNGRCRERMGRNPMEYKVVPMGYYNPRWVGLIKGPPHASTAHPPNSRGYFRDKPIGTYESRVAAAHALLDYLEIG